MRTPIALFGLALLVRLVLIAMYADPAYPDSYYYVDVARAIAAEIPPMPPLTHPHAPA